jgi:predicted acylesterase/phospholipase RssA
MLNVGATDVNSAELIRFNETQSSQDLIESLMCSSAIPGIFPWQSF